MFSFVLSLFRTSSQEKLPRVGLFLATVFVVFHLLGFSTDSQIEFLRALGRNHETPAPVKARETIWESATLFRRDDYSCSAANPCSNGACCGASGYCGYGPTYCGDGCLSQCDATAECGQYASTVNATCPLNVCCSQYGFCGTTEEFCDDSCQSNCDLHPDPPSDDNSDGPLSKVIGYYEGWSYNSDCHTTYPTDLPLSALTHINFAFAYIDPGTYQVATMEAKMTSDLFTQTTAVKDLNANLKIFVSIGGWTFSDNDIVTQPLFGEIAADENKRQEFANNVLKFMNTYGFDGVDLDWEYPGAPDRGGNEDDTSNYVELVKTMRETFDASGRELSITFTAPSSFWYLRWFDLPGMMEYCNWINFMTYDLHGVWDATNPIGSIVQSHTNLTDIKLATELLWRVGVKPSQVALGFGFYGRSFTLQDPGCSAPGCPFSAGGTAGACTATSGYLAWYEIKDIMDSNPDVELIHDEEAAVKYMTWDTNQWISFDDAETFQEKLNWAKDVGFSGSLIWASDQDDYEWSAHQALLNQTIVSNDEILTNVLSAAVKAAATDLMNINYTASCFRQPDCTDLTNAQVSCGVGYDLVGYDRAKCNGKDDEEYWGQAICCPLNHIPESCLWRGGGRDCNGQCHQGEVMLFQSKVGGGDFNDFASESGLSTCKNGDKAYCCADPNYSKATEGCYWTACGEQCQSGESDIASTKNLDGKCPWTNQGNHYCCKDNPAPLENCHWVGKGDCADNTCSSSDVTLLVNDVDNKGNSCSWWRKKSLCCTAKTVTPLDCGNDDDFCDLYSGSCEDDNEDSDSTTSSDKRDELGRGIDTTVDGHYSNIEKRGGARQFSVIVSSPRNAINVASFGYAGFKEYLNGVRASQVLQSAWMRSDTLCSTGSLAAGAIPTYAKPAVLQADHVYELQNIKTILQSAVGGYLPSGGKMKASIVAESIISRTWETAQEGLSSLDIPSITRYMVDGSQGSRVGDPRIPNDRIMWQLGSLANARPLVLLQNEVNGLKGTLFNFAVDDATGRFTGKLVRGLVKERNFNDYLLEALNGGGEGIQNVFLAIRNTMGILSYLADSQVVGVLNDVRIASFKEFKNYANVVPEAGGLVDVWREVDADMFSFALKTAKQFVESHLLTLTESYAAASPRPANYDEVILTAKIISAQLSEYVDPALVSPA